MHLDHIGERYRQIMEEFTCRFPYSLSIPRVHTQHTHPLATKIQQRVWYFCPEKHIIDSIPKVCIRAVYIDACWLEHAKFLTLRRKAGVQYKPYYFHKKFKHGETFFSVNYIHWKHSKSQILRCHLRANIKRQSS